jgi:hypothetical protein
MLRSFRLSNHRCFLEEQELLLIPSAPGRDHEVLTVAGIYGANASGKSSLLDGLRFMAQSVDQSFRVWRADQEVPREPFRLGAWDRRRPSTFVVELVIDDVPYTYGFSVDDVAVKEEWLYSYPEKRKRVLFEREGADIRLGTTVGKIRTALDGLGDLTRPNALFLSIAAQFSSTPMSPVSKWLTGRLRFHRGTSDLVSGVDLARWLANCLEGGLRSKLIGLLAAADVGITDIYVRNEHKSPRGGLPELRFVHGDAGDSFGIENESAGTQNWLGLLPAVLDALGSGGTLVVDEIDASLHSLLTVRLLHLFTSVETNPKHAQLIFTTHDTTPLGSYIGRDVLQRDQVWFVERDSRGRSRLYPLTDFKPRIGENTEKRYLTGSYGAVPILSDVDFDEAVGR